MPPSSSTAGVRDHTCGAAGWLISCSLSSRLAERSVSGDRAGSCRYWYTVNTARPAPERWAFGLNGGRLMSSSSSHRDVSVDSRCCRHWLWNHRRAPRRDTERLAPPRNAARRRKEARRGAAAERAADKKVGRTEGQPNSGPPERRAAATEGRPGVKAAPANSYVKVKVLRGSSAACSPAPKRQPPSRSSHPNWARIGSKKSNGSLTWRGETDAGNVKGTQLISNAELYGIGVPGNDVHQLPGRSSQS